MLGCWYDCVLVCSLYAGLQYLMRHYDSTLHTINDCHHAAACRKCWLCYQQHVHVRRRMRGACTHLCIVMLAATIRQPISQQAVTSMRTGLHTGWQYKGPDQASRETPRSAWRKSVSNSPIFPASVISILWPRTSANTPGDIAVGASGTGISRVAGGVCGGCAKGEAASSVAGARAAAGGGAAAGRCGGWKACCAGCSVA